MAAPSHPRYVYVESLMIDEVIKMGGADQKLLMK